MVPLANIVLGLLTRPASHGAVGFWDEVLNIVPLIFGAGLLFYLYFGKRKRRAAVPPVPLDNAAPPPNAEPPAPPQP